MDELDQRWLRESKALMEHMFPGAVTKLDSLGGTYRAPPKPKILRAKGGLVEGVQIHVVCWLKSLHIEVSIKLTYKEHGDVVHCAYHCGPSQNQDDVFFRICTNSHQGLHFHLKGYENYGDGRTFEAGHIPAELADPPIDADLMKFLDHVDSFVKSKAKVLPLRVKQ